MLAISSVRELVSRALKDPTINILFNGKIAEVVGAFKAKQDVLPEDKLIEGAKIINLTKTHKGVEVFSCQWYGRGGAMPIGFQLFPTKITDLSALPPALAEALSELLKEEQLTLDTSPQT